MQDAGLKKAIKAAGGTGGALASSIGVTRQAVNQWSRVPATHVVRVENATGVPREQLRPDLYKRRK